MSSSASGVAAALARSGLHVAKVVAQPVVVGQQELHIHQNRLQRTRTYIPQRQKTQAGTIIFMLSKHSPTGGSA
jgi:hypothetical protein